MKLIIFFVNVVALLVYAGVAAGAEGHDHSEHRGSMMGHQHEEGKTDAINVGNKICPVSGEPVESMGGAYQLEHNDKIYSFCCEGCAEGFKKNPEKYIK